MKMIWLYFLLAVIGLNSCNSTLIKANNPPKKALVVYFSWGGNTREVAKQIGEITKSKVFELLPVKPYTCLRYGKNGVEGIEEVAKREVKEGYQPRLKALPDNLEQYDVIYVGSPCWFYTIAPPVATFLATAKLSGKTVVPFMTHGGSRMGKGVDDIKRLASKANVTEGLPISENHVKQAKNEISIWLKKNKLIK